MRKKILLLLLMCILSFIVLPELAFAEDGNGWSGTTPKGNDIANYTWDEDGFLDKADIRLAIANVIMSINVLIVNYTLVFLEFAVNPTNFFFPDGGNWFISILTFFFDIAFIIKTLCFIFMPIVLGITILIDFAKSDYRQMFKRVAQVAIAFLALITYNNWMNNPTQLKQIIDLSQNISYIILAGTTGAINVDKSATDNFYVAGNFESSFNNDFKTVKDSLFELNIELPWEYGEFKRVNLLVDNTPFYNRGLGFGERWKFEQHAEDVKKKLEENPYKPYESGTKEGESRINDKTLWRDVIPYYPTGSDERDELIDIVNNDGTFASGFSGGHRFMVASTLFITMIPQVVLWIIFSVFMLLTFVMFMFAIPLGSIVFAVAILPFEYPVRLVKGWFGFLSGSLIAKYLTTLILGTIIGLQEKITGMIGGVSDSLNISSISDSTDPATYGTTEFGLGTILINGMFYTLLLLLVYMFKDKLLNPMTFVRFATENAFNSMGFPYKMRSRDPLMSLRNKAYRKIDNLDEKWKNKDGLGSGLFDKFKGKGSGTDPEDAGNTIQQPPRPTDDQLLDNENIEAINPDLENNQENENLDADQEGLETDDNLELSELEDIEKIDPDDIELVVPKELKGPDEVEEEEESNKITYENESMKELLAKGLVTPKLNRNSELSEGSFQYEEHELEDGSKIMKLTPTGNEQSNHDNLNSLNKNKTSTDMTAEPNLKALPSGRLLESGVHFNRTSEIENDVEMEILGKKEEDGTITYKSEPMKKLLASGTVTPKLNRNSTLSEGSFQFKQHELPDGGKIISISPANIGENSTPNTPSDVDIIESARPEMLNGNSPVILSQDIVHEQSTIDVDAVNPSNLKDVLIQQTDRENLLGKGEEDMEEPQMIDFLANKGWVKPTQPTQPTVNPVNQPVVKVQPSIPQGQPMVPNQLGQNVFQTHQPMAPNQLGQGVFQPTQPMVNPINEQSSVNVNIPIPNVVPSVDIPIQSTVDAQSQIEQPITFEQSIDNQQPPVVDTTPNFEVPVENIQQEQQYQFNHQQVPPTFVQQPDYQTVVPNIETPIQDVAPNVQQSQQQIPNVNMQQDVVQSIPTDTAYVQSANTPLEQEVIVEMPEYEPLTLQPRQNVVSEAPIQLTLEDPFDDSYMFDNRLTEAQKREIEQYQTEAQEVVYANAVALVQSKGKASQNLLRKELKLDNDVAKELINRMEKDKIIGEREGTKGHPVLSQSSAPSVGSAPPPLTRKAPPSLSPRR